MSNERVDIADILKDIEDANGWMAASDLVPFANKNSWRSSCRFWLLSLSLHVVLLALAFAFGGSRPFGRGGLPEGLFFSTTFSTGEGATSGQRGGNSEIDTTIESETESTAASSSPFRAVSSTSITRPLLTLTPADPESVFNAEPIESLTAELASLQNTASVRQATQRRLTNEVQSAARSKPTAFRDREVIEDTPSNEVTSVPLRALPTDKSKQIDAGNAAGHQRGQGSPRPGRGEPQLGDGDGGASMGSADGNRTTFFGIGAKAKRFVYVIDASESMHEHRAMQVARDELWESLQELTESATFQVVFFNLKQHALSRRGERPKMLAATASNLRLAKQFLNGIQPDSGTDRLTALTHALSFDPDVIFLLTDADAPEFTPKDLADIRRLNRRKAVINIVEFGKQLDIGRDNFLKALARQHGGSHRYHNLVSPVGQ